MEGGCCRGEPLYSVTLQTAESHYKCGGGGSKHKQYLIFLEAIQSTTFTMTKLLLDMTLRLKIVHTAHLARQPVFGRWAAGQARQ